MKIKDILDMVVHTCDPSYKRGTWRGIVVQTVHQAKLELEVKQKRDKVVWSSGRALA
jgi:hypothetical protein